MPNSREQFEAAYRKAYPTTCELVPDVFAMEYDEYTRTPTEIGWKMWQAGAAAERKACAMECERISPHDSFTLDFSSGIVIGAQQCASAIRDRSAP